MRVCVYGMHTLFVHPRMIYTRLPAASVRSLPCTCFGEVDSSFLGNIGYTGDYFLRIPPEKRKWIAHVDPATATVDPATGKKQAYLAMHGHRLNGTKFFTWGQSGPGR